MSAGRLFPARFVAWQRRGLSSRAASALAAAGCDSIEDVARLGRTERVNDFDTPGFGI
jgi:hypothetical protein